MNNDVVLSYMTYGADIEFFGSDNGKPVLSTDGNKIYSENKHIEKDGPLFEIRPSYSICRMILQDRIIKMIDNKPILDKSSITIEKRKYDKLSDKDKELGCEPDLNVYNEFHPKNHSTRLRTAGFHIHIGQTHTRMWVRVNKRYNINIDITDKNIDDIRKLAKDIQENSIITEDAYKIMTKYTQFAPTVFHNKEKTIGNSVKVIESDINIYDKFRDPNTIKLMDLFVANTLITIMRNKNRRYELKRRQLYGQAGSYRKKEYGLEYRVLSNYILTRPALMHLMYGLIRVAFKYNLNQTELKALQDNEERIKYTINNVDYREAQKIYNEITYPILKQCNLNECCADDVYRSIIYGLQKGKLDIEVNKTTYEKAYAGKTLNWRK